MYPLCDQDYSEYYNIFMKNFVQTLAQLSAAVVTSTFAVPLYSYYSRRRMEREDLYRQAHFPSSDESDEINELESEVEVEQVDDIDTEDDDSNSEL